jgi:hypothetical protein
MTTIRAEEVRIPRHAREAVARHEHLRHCDRIVGLDVLTISFTG